MDKRLLSSAFLIVAPLLGCSGSNIGDPSTSLEDQAACVTGPGVTVLHSGWATGLSTDGTNVIASTESGIVTIPLAGGQQTVLATPDDPYGLYTLGGLAYFTASHPDGPVDPQGKQSSATSLYTVPIAGGIQTAVLPDALPMEAGASDGASLYLAAYTLGAIAKLTPPVASAVNLPLDSTAISVDAIAVHGSFIYVAGQDLGSNDPKAGVIERIPKAGGPAERIVTGIGNPWGLVAGDAGIFWAEDPPKGVFTNGHIARADLDGSNVTTLAAQPASALALQGQNLYFLSDVVGRVPVTGGAVETIATGLEGAAFLRVTGGNVVWVDRFTKALSDPTPMTIATACVPGS